MTEASIPTSVWDGLLFDFDGVIADTEPLHWRCWSSALARYGFALDWLAYCAHCRGVAPSRMRRALAALTDVVDQIPDLEEQYAACKESSFALLKDHPPVCVETISLLQGLRGFRIGLVTTAARAVVEPVLAATGILEVFAVAVYGEDVQRHKPAPDAYTLARKRLGARRTLVFEDTEVGAASAKAAGLEVVLVKDCVKLADLVREAVRNGDESCRPVDGIS